MDKIRIKLQAMIVSGLLVFFQIFCASGCENRKEAQPQHEYYIFIDAWNERLDKIKGSERFKLESRNNIYGRLEQWSRAFANRSGPEVRRELGKLEEELPSTTFHAYEKFREKHYKNNSLRLAEGLDAQQLATTLNEWLGIEVNGRIPDYVTRQTVLDIVYMNSLCSFFLNEKDNLHKQGIDTGIESCGQLSTRGRFPWLDALVDGDGRENKK